MHAPGVPAVLRRPFQVLFRGFLAVAMMGSLAECPWSDSGSGGGKEATVAFRLDRSILFVAPGDFALVRLDAGLGPDVTGHPSYELVERDDFGVGAPTSPADTTFEITEPNSGGAAELRIQTGPGTLPGVYQIPLEVNAGSIVRERTLTLVVLPTDATPVAGPVVQVAGGDTHSLALLADGSVWAWGRNDRGQLGDGTLNDRQVPVPVAGLPGPAQAVAAGGRHSLALLDDGTVWGWGDNEHQQVLTFSEGEAPPRVVVTPAQAHSSSSDLGGEQNYSNVVAIAAGDAHNALLQGNGVLRMFGDNSRFQLAALGYTTAAHATTLDLAVVEVVAIAAGGDHTLAVGDDDSVWGWGASDDGQLGGAVNTPIQDEPIDLAFVGDIVDIGAGLAHSLLIDPDSQVRTFGANGFGQLGDGSRDTPDAQPKTPPFLLNVVQVDGGRIHSLAREADGEVRAWGNNRFGQVSDSGNMTPDGSGRTDQLVPVRVAGVPHSSDIAAGGRHSLSVDDLCGKAWSWGDNIAAQLGDAGVAPDGGFRATPQPVYGLGDDPAGAGCRVLLSVVSSGPGRITATDATTPVDDEACELPCTASFPAGDVVTLTAVPEPGAAFVDWGGNCTGTDAVIDIIMDRARSCRARFNEPPVAAFTVDRNPYLARSLAPAVFDARATYDPDGLIVAYEWDFDDDGTFDAAGSTASVDDPPSGTHTVRLRVTDNLGATDDATLEWRVLDDPEASFTWDPELPAPGQVVTFDGSASTASGPIVTYEWDFDEDGTSDASGVVVDHAFATAGDHRVSLLVMDSFGLPDVHVEFVTVGDGGGPGGDVTLTVVPLGGGQGQTLNLEPDVFECTYDGPTSFPSPCALTVPSGTFVRLEAIAGGGGFVFSHWGVGDCDAEVAGGGVAPECHVTLTADREVGVSFE